MIVGTADDDFTPDWSPDDGHVVFSRTLWPWLMLANTVTGHVEQLTNGPYDIYPRWKRIPSNCPPAAANNAYTVAEDQTLAVPAPGVLGNDSDPNGDMLTAVLVAGPSHGDLALNADGSFLYEPAANFSGLDSFTYRARDGSLDSNVATVEITVTPVNHAPVAENDAYTVAEDETLTVSADLGLLANDRDVDGDAIVAELVSGPSGVLTLEADGSFTYSPIGDYYGQVSFTYHAKELDGTESSGLATVTITVTPVNDSPVIDSITAPIDPHEVETEISVSAAFRDADGDDTHTATWNWGDGTETTGVVTEPSGGASGTIAGSHTYTVPGVYRLVLTVTDVGGLSDEAEHLYLVVYDPDGGFVTGGGWIMSPAGAYVPDGSLTGKATFGFNSKYKKGASVPTGETQFQFRVADLNFHSTEYQWLVVAGAKAKYKGTGTINGAGNYGFMLTAIDGALLAGAEPDKFRIKIWDSATEAVVYDNQPGEADDSDAATAIGGGSIVVHKGTVTTNQLTAARITAAAAAPTPRGAQIVYTLSADAAVSSEVLNIAGRVVRRVCTDKEAQAGANTLLWDGNSEFGTQAPNGRYIVRIVARTADGAQSQAVVPLMIRR